MSASTVRGSDMWSRIIDCEQNDAAWLAARLGIPTASEFHTIRAKGQGKVRRDYMLRLIGERLTGQPTERATTRDMVRGHEWEAQAVETYAMLTDAEPEKVGFIRNDESDCGASPDRIVGDDGLLEVKTKAPHLQLGVLLDDAVPSEHMDQIQGQLWVAERQWCDFISYWPGLPMFLRRVERDEAYIKDLRSDVERFFDELLAAESRIRSMYDF